MWCASSLAHAAQGDLLQNALALMSPPQWQHFSEQVQTTMQREMQEIAELPEYAVHLTRMQAALKTCSSTARRLKHKQQKPEWREIEEKCQPS